MNAKSLFIVTASIFTFVMLIAFASTEQPKNDRLGAIAKLPNASSAAPHVAMK